MLKSLFKLASLSTLAMIGIVGLLFYQHQTRQSARIVELEEENVELNDLIDRLGSERRIAELVVADQSIVDGQQQTTGSH
jgi:hypothetical protein